MKSRRTDYCFAAAEIACSSGIVAVSDASSDRTEPRCCCCSRPSIDAAAAWLRAANGATSASTDSPPPRLVSGLTVQRPMVHEVGSIHRERQRMDPTARKGTRCPVCKEGAIVERTGPDGRYLGCSTYNPARPQDPASDRTMWRLDGTMIQPKTNARTLVLGLILSLAFFAVISFVLTKVF